MVAVRREGVVVGAKAVARADLSRLLAKTGRPESQLSLSLQLGRLGVHPADQDHVPVQPSQLVVAQRDVVSGVMDALPFRGEKLHRRIRPRAVAHRTSEAILHPIPDVGGAIGVTGPARSGAQ